MKPKDRYLCRAGRTVDQQPQQHHPLPPHHHHQRQPEQEAASSHHQPLHQQHRPQEEEEGDWLSEPMDLSVKKRTQEEESASGASLESLMYGELAARYMMLNAEMRDKQLSSILPLLLLRPFAAAVASQRSESSDGSETELRLADTTELLEERKQRMTRPLTGRYVRHGTGASPATLLSLRNMIHERQRQRSRLPSHKSHKPAAQRRTRTRVRK